MLAVSLAAALVAFLLLVTADLDRPTRGMIQVPDTALKNQLASMTAARRHGTPIALTPYFRVELAGLEAATSWVRFAPRCLPSLFLLRW